jgi:hypothetical protein
LLPMMASLFLKKSIFVILLHVLYLLMYCWVYVRAQCPPRRRLNHSDWHAIVVFGLFCLIVTCLDISFHFKFCATFYYSDSGSLDSHYYRATLRTPYPRYGNSTRTAQVGI